MGNNARSHEAWAFRQAGRPPRRVGGAIPVRTPMPASTSSALSGSAQTAERGRFDMLFSADTQSAWTTHPDGLHRMHYVAWIEPFTLMAALSGFTRNIGLVCTASTTYEEPFALARRFASLDLVSAGRAGWNLITSGNETEAQNFGRVSHPPKAERYRRGREFAEVVNGLWQSWDDDAFVRDRDSGVFFDREKMHVLDHHGKYFDVRGPLNVPRSPQGQPVLVQAGASDDGIELAAETAEVVFAAQNRIEGGKAFYAELKGRMAKYGRNPDHLKILPGLAVTVGRSADEAKEKYQRMQDLIHPDVGLGLLSRRISFDLSGYPLDGPLPELPRNDVASSRSDVMAEMAKRENLTIRQLISDSPGRAGIWSWSERRSRSSTRCSNGWKSALPTGSTRSCPTSQAVGTTSSNWSSRNCSVGTCSAPNTRAAL